MTRSNAITFVVSRAAGAYAKPFGHKGPLGGWYAR